VARSVAVTFDYRCPFAYNGNLAVINAIRGGNEIDFRFVPFSLDQVHVGEGEPPMWERDPEDWGTGMRSLLYGIAVRDTFPDQFFDAHLALFAARHEHSKQLADEDVLKEAVASAGLDPETVAEEAWSGRPLKTLETEHTEWSTSTACSAFPRSSKTARRVRRFMDRGNVEDLERMLEFLTWARSTSSSGQGSRDDAGPE
jgi:hypothetical protein